MGLIVFRARHEEEIMGWHTESIKEMMMKINMKWNYLNIKMK